MPRFSANSRSRLNSCHPDLQAVFREVIADFDCTVLCGFRGEAEQNRLYEAGKTQVRYPDSNHNKSPSEAADVAPYPIDWTGRERFHLFAGYVLGTADRLYEEGRIGHRLRWGGDWDGDFEISDNKFDDLVHFELVRE